MKCAAIAAALLLTTTPALARAEEAPAPSVVDAPPPAPYAKGLVVDANVGAIGFLGQFRHLAPPGPWFHGQVGYEILSWLMIYGEGELAFTDTSNLDNQPNIRTFDMWGFGGGARFTWRILERLGLYGQPGVGVIKADVPKNELAIHGFHDAESFAPWLGLRLGVEWYQVDRHLAFGLTTSIRTLTGFAKTGGSTDTPLAMDGGIALRYAF